MTAIAAGQRVKGQAHIDLAQLVFAGVKLLSKYLPYILSFKL